MRTTLTVDAGNVVAMNSPLHRPGIFIALEGGDGAGKSTQAELLGKWLIGRGREAVLTLEPGGTPLGVMLREALLHGGDIDPRTEALLFATDRSHHVASLIRPALARDAVVITDRYMDSSIAYQGAARRLGRQEIKDLSIWGTYGLRPNLTVVLDLPPEVGASRRAGAPDRMERESLEFHDRVRATFLQLAEAEPERYLVVDATQDPETVHREIVARVADLVTEARA